MSVYLHRCALLAAAVAWAVGCNAVLGFEEGEPLATGAGGQGTGGATAGAAPGGNGGDGGTLEPGTLLWSKRFGGLDGDLAWAVAAGPSDAIALAGTFTHSVDFGTESIEASHELGEAFVAMLDADGNTLWSRAAASTSGAEARGVAIAPDGGVICAGSFATGIDWGSGLMAGGGLIDAFVVKLDASGDYVWGHGFGGADIDECPAVAVDVTGSVIIAGAFYGTFQIGTVTLASAGGKDAFVIKLDAEGNVLWGQRFGGGGSQCAEGLAVDGAGDVIVAGRFQDSIDFGCAPLSSPIYDATFVAKLAPDGGCLWAAASLDGNGHAGAEAVAVHDDVLLTGDFEVTLDLGGGPMLGEGGGRDGYLVSLDSYGNHKWSKRFGDPAAQFGHGVAADGEGNIALVGRFEGTISFDGDVLGSAGEMDAFVARFDRNGALSWSHRFGDFRDQGAYGVAIDSGGNVISAGCFEGTVDFGGGALEATGRDIFVAKHAP